MNPRPPKSPVPEDPADVTPDPGALERLETICRNLSRRLRDSKILARQACYRPVTANGLPIIGAVLGVGARMRRRDTAFWGFCFT